MKYHWKKLTSMLVAAILTFNMVGQTVVSFATDPNVSNGSAAAEEIIPATPTPDPVAPVEDEGEPSTAPAEDEDKQPAEDEDKQPVEGEDKQPVEGEDNQPAEDEDNQPVEGEDNQPAEGEDNQPAEDEDNQPVEGEGNQPAEDEDGQDAAPEVKTITQITLPEAALNAALHTAQENLQLPTVLTVQVEGQEEPVELPVTWVCDNYNAELAGSYIFTAQLGEGYVLAEGISLPQITVTVEDNSGEFITVWSEPVFFSSFHDPEPYGISLFNTGSYTGSYEDQLNELEQVLYDTILASPAQNSSKDISSLGIKLTGSVSGSNIILDPAGNQKLAELQSSFQKAAVAVCYDHPEYSWILTGGIETGYAFGGYEGSSEITVTQASFTLKAVPDFALNMSAMDSKINEIVSSAPSTTLQEKLKFFHDEICELTTYNTEASKISSDSVPKDWLYAWSPYEVFVGTGAQEQNSVVCEGYARAFKMLCDAANIPCALISGDGGGPHMWNAVKMDDEKWYAVDVTWDDQEDSLGTIDKYFLKPSTGFSDHTPEPECGLVYPVLSSTDYEQPTEPENPTMTVVSSASEENWTKERVTFTVTVANATEDISCVYTLNGSNEKTVTLSEGKGTVTVDTDGEHTLTFKLKKGEEVLDTQTLSAKIDKTAPTISNVKVEETEEPLLFSIITNKQVKVSATVTDAISGIASVTAKVSDDSFKMTKDASGDTYSCIINKEYDNAAVSVTATDNAGNESTPFNASDNITTDKTAPVITTITPSDVKDVTATVNLTVDSNSKVYYLSANNKPSSADEIVDNKTYIDVTTGTQGTITLNNLTANTAYTVYAVAVDEAGNRSEIKSVSFTTTQTQLSFNGTLSASGTYGVTWENLTISVSEGGKVTANGQEVTGTWSWSNPSAEKPQVGITTAQATFTPSSGMGYAPLTADVSITISKAAANVVSNPADQTIKADSEKNTEDALKAMLPATVTVTADNNVSEKLGVTWSTADGFDAKGKTYTYTGTLTDSENVSTNGQTATAKITVEKVEATLPTIAPISVKYTGNASVSPADISAVPKSGSITVTGDKETTVDYTISWTGTVDLRKDQVGQPAQTISGTVTFTNPPAWLTLPTSLNVTQDITVVDKAVATVTVTAPDNLVYDGQPVEESDFNVQTTLNARSTPEMTFTYFNKGSSDPILAPKDAGEYSVQVTYETDTHYGQSEAVEFTIHPKAVTINKGTIHFEKTYDGNAETTGITPTGALGVDGVIGGDTVTINYTKATFDSEKAGTRNVLFEGITLDNPNYKVETDTFTAIGAGTINKDDANAEVPTGLTALTNLQKTLSDVTLPTGWAWKEPATELKADSNTPNPTFPAIFTPTDTENYQPVEKEVSVAVSEITFTGGNVPTELEIGGSGSLSHNAYVTGAGYTIPTGEYRADNTNVVSIEGSTVTGKAVGTATISWVISINGQELSFELGAIKVYSKQVVDPDATIPSIDNPVVSTEIPEDMTDVYWKVEEGDDASKAFPAPPAGAEQQFLLISLRNNNNDTKATLEQPILVRMIVPTGFNSNLKFQLYSYNTTQISYTSVNAVLKTAEDGTQYLEFMFDNTADVYSIQYNIPNTPTPTPDPDPTPDPTPGGNTNSGSSNSSGSQNNTSSSDDRWSSSDSSSDKGFLNTLFGRLKANLTYKPRSTSEEDKTTTVKAKAKMTVSNETISAEVSENTLDTAISKAIEESKKDKTSPVVQVTLNTEKDVHSMSVTLPTESLDTLAKDSDAQLVLTSPVATVKFDAKALKAISKQADGKVTLKVAPVETAALTAEQKAVVGDNLVVELLLLSDGKVISDFEGGNATVTIPYELKDGEAAEGLVVYFLDNDGKLYECETSYDAANKCITFITTHFSKYVVGYDADKAASSVSNNSISNTGSSGSDKYNPTTGASNMVSVMALAATLSLGGLVALGRKKR